MDRLDAFENVLEEILTEYNKNWSRVRIIKKSPEDEDN